MFNAVKKKGMRMAGGAIIEIVVVLTGILTGGIGLLILDAVTCDFNVIFNSGCGKGGGGGGGGGAQACTSAQNVCGMTNTGFKQNGTCNATPPPDSDCPPPSISSNGFYAQPAIVVQGEKTKLFWEAENASACTITSDSGFSHKGDESGSVNTDRIDATTNFTLTCENGDGGPQVSKTLKVVITPHYKEI